MNILFLQLDCGLSSISGVYEYRCKEMPSRRRRQYIQEMGAEEYFKIVSHEKDTAGCWCISKLKSAFVELMSIKYIGSKNDTVPFWIDHNRLRFPRLHCLFPYIATLDYYTYVPLIGIPIAEVGSKSSGTLFWRMSSSSCTFFTGHILLFGVYL